MRKTKRAKSLGKLKEFKEGLEKLGLDPDRVIEDWEWRGGDKSDFHRNYWGMMKMKCEIPAKVKKCVCKTPIVYQNWISNPEKTQAIAIGSECIRAFIDNGELFRKCTICNSIHKNRKNNYCKTCRVSMYKCESCGGEYHKTEFSRCSVCNKRIRVCLDNCSNKKNYCYYHTSK